MINEGIKTALIILGSFIAGEIAMLVMLMKAVKSVEDKKKLGKKE